MYSFLRIVQKCVIFVCGKKKKITDNKITYYPTGTYGNHFQIFIGWVLSKFAELYFFFYQVRVRKRKPLNFSKFFIFFFNKIKEKKTQKTDQQYLPIPLRCEKHLPSFAIKIESCADASDSQAGIGSSTLETDAKISHVYQSRYPNE